MPDVNLQPPFEAYAGEEPFVFVSYAHKDGHLVYPAIKALHDSGVRIWFDGGIDPGNEWAEDISKALEKAHIFLVFITPAAVESNNVRDEIGLALSEKKTFVAVHLQETQLPGSLKLRMSRLQAIIKYNMTEENFRKKLLSCLSVEGVVEAKKKTEVQTVTIQEETKSVSNIAEPVLKKSLSKESSENLKIENCEVTDKFLLQVLKETFTQISNAGISCIFFFPDIPKNKFDNVLEKYSKLLKPKEQIFLVYDGTVFGSAKDGFILTNFGVGWSEAFGSPKYCLYKNIELKNLQKDSLNNLIFVKSLPGANVSINHINTVLLHLIDFFEKIQNKKYIQEEANSNTEVADPVLKKSVSKEGSENSKIENCETTEKFLLQVLKETFTQISNTGISNIFLFPDIPKNKSDNVLQKYSKLLEPKEQILLIYDGTMFGSAKDGFILTNLGVGWSETFGSPKYCLYENIELKSVQKKSESELMFVNSLPGAYIYSGQINIVLPNLIDFFEKIQNKKYMQEDAKSNREIAESVLKKSVSKEGSENSKIENCETTEKFLLQVLKETFTQISNTGISNIFLFPDIPKNKSDNVLQKYSKLLEPKEQILLIYDGTMFGSAKDGFILTNLGVGWSETFGSPKYCLYENIELKSVQKKSESELIFVNSLPGAFIYSGQINVVLPNLINFFEKIQNKKLHEKSK